MRPTQILSQEHRVIEIVLECLGKMAEEAVQTQRIDQQGAREAIDFFRHFADGCHHAKEENQLFPAMEGRGFDRNTGPLSVMLYEHTVGRDAVRGMEQAVEDQDGGEQHAARQFVEHARRYMDLLRQHIEKEDHCLFTMADQVFSQQEQDDLLRRFEQAEKDVIGEEAKQRYLQLAQRLGERYGINRAAATPPTAHAHACGASSCEAT